MEENKKINNNSQEENIQAVAQNTTADTAPDIENTNQNQENEEMELSKILMTNAANHQEKMAEVTTSKAKIFKKYKIKDIVFLAIMSACMIITSCYMPWLNTIPVFGIVQIGLGIQFSLFPTIGMLKVRKPGALLFMSLCCGILLGFMAPVMFFCMLVCAIIAEGLTLLIFRGYKKTAASVFAGCVFFPSTLPFLYIWYNFLYTFTGEEGQAVSAFLGSSAGVAIGMSIAAIAVSVVGAVLGWVISKELQKAGALKK